MMKIKTILFGVALLLSFNGNACDVCGCSLGGYYLGVLPNGQTHLIGFRYQTASFSAFIDNRLIEDEFSNDTYRRFEILTGFSLTKSLFLTASIPYSYNSMQGSHQNIESHGLSDPTLILYWKPLKQIETGNWTHNLMVGSGLKLPIGEYDKVDNGSIVNRNFQLGSGSTDFIFSGNYTLRNNKSALNLEGSLKYNTANDVDYRFGNQRNLSLSYFRDFTIKELGVIPFASINYESAGKHTEGSVPQANTGGSSVLSGIGLQLFYKVISLNSQFQIPVDQNYNVDEISEIEAKGRFQLSVAYNFF